MVRRSKRIGELLLDFDYITEEQFQEALKHNRNNNSDAKFGEIMVDKGFISEKDLIRVLEFQLNIPHVDLEDYFLDPALSQFVPENIARRHDCVPLEKNNEALRVVMSDPNDLVAIDDIERVSGLGVEPVIGSPSQIQDALNWLYSEDSIDISEFLEEYEVQQTEDESYEANELMEMVEEAPIIRLANSIISNAYKRGASDIHIEPEDDYVQVRYRVDGVLRREMSAPKSSHRALVSRFKIIADLDITEHRVPQDGRIQMRVNRRQLDMRVSTLPTVQGEKVVIRLLTRDNSLLNLENLGLTQSNLDIFRELISKPHGILLLTGPTGSGKTTTLFAALNEINNPRINLVTIEDPVEYQVEGIYQVQARPKAGLTFAKTLRSILRQDPDVIMVGEMRDEETAEIAVRAALTGHMVFSTLHTNDAVSSVTRLVDMGLPPYLVASSVIGVVAQRLVRQLCPECRSKKELTRAEKNFLDTDEITEAYQAKGCKKCGNSGYRGRLALQEIFVLDDDIQELISDNAGEGKLFTAAKQQGMNTLKEDGIEKLKDGRTDVSELRRILF